MSNVVVSQFVTLDGIFEDPGGSEGTAGGGWAFKFNRGPEGDQFKLDELDAAGALLLGRVTYEGFAQAWPSVQDEQGFADKMNGMPKYVVSTTLTHADWQNSTILNKNVVEEIQHLKEQPGQNILVAGSGRLVHTLMQHQLVDEYRFMVHPLVLGKGKRLFTEETGQVKLRLVETKAFTTGIVILHYQPV